MNNKFNLYFYTDEENKEKENKYHNKINQKFTKIENQKNEKINNKKIEIEKEKNEEIDKMKMNKVLSIRLNNPNFMLKYQERIDNIITENIKIIDQENQKNKIEILKNIFVKKCNSVFNKIQKLKNQNFTKEHKYYIMRTILPIKNKLVILANIIYQFYQSENLFCSTIEKQELEEFITINYNKVLYELYLILETSTYFKIKQLKKFLIEIFKKYEIPNIGIEVELKIEDVSQINYDEIEKNINTLKNDGLTKDQILENIITGYELEYDIAIDIIEQMN